MRHSVDNGVENIPTLLYYDNSGRGKEFPGRTSMDFWIGILGLIVFFLIVCGIAAALGWRMRKLAEEREQWEKSHRLGDSLADYRRARALSAPLSASAASDQEGY